MNATTPEIVVNASHRVPLSLLGLCTFVMIGGIFAGGFLLWVAIILAVLGVLLSSILILPRLKRPVLIADHESVTVSQTGIDSLTLHRQYVAGFEEVMERGKPHFTVLAIDPEQVLDRAVMPALHDQLRATQQRHQRPIVAIVPSKAMKVTSEQLVQRMNQWLQSGTTVA